MRAKLVIWSVLVLSSPLQSQAETLKVMTSGGLIASLKALIPQYEKASHNDVLVISGASMGTNPTAIPARLQRGEPADLVMMIRSELDKLVSDGLVKQGSVTDIGVGYIAMAIKLGKPKPDIQSVDSFRRALLSATSIVMTDSAGGNYLNSVVFKRLGVAHQIASKTTVVRGVPVGPLVARGEYDVGFQQLSELKQVRGIDVVGMIPFALQRPTMFSAGIVERTAHSSAARNLIRYFSSPVAVDELRRSGIIPANH